MRDLVIHETGLVLDFAKDDYGGVLEAAVIAAARQRGKVGRGEFTCFAHRSHEKPWLYLRQHGATIVAAHWPGTKLNCTYDLARGVSDEHKRQVEYIQRAGQAAGFDVATEVSHPTKVRSDAVIYGPTTTGIEVQRSHLTTTAAKARTTKARRAGVLPIWFSDAASDPNWMFQVPSVRMNEQPWDVVPRAGSVTVVSGVRIVTARRCRDIPDSQCPDRRRGCNKWHAVHEPMLGVTVDDLSMRIPSGDLVPINYKAPSGKASILIVSRINKQRYEAVSDTSADLPLRPKERLVRSGDRATCASDAGKLVVAEPMPIAPSWSRPKARQCEAGVTPCGAPAGLYPCGWRCQDHRP